MNHSTSPLLISSTSPAEHVLSTINISAERHPQGLVGRIAFVCLFCLKSGFSGGEILVNVIDSSIQPQVKPWGNDEIELSSLTHPYYVGNLCKHYFRCPLQHKAYWLLFLCPNGSMPRDSEVFLRLFLLANPHSGNSPWLWKVQWESCLLLCLSRGFCSNISLSSFLLLSDVGTDNQSWKQIENWAHFVEWILHS